MFELLLQADRALANGALDQAERTYWQLVELDPTNAIAVAGLARVWLERGDERSARTFADRALSIDPDSIAARRVLQAVTHESPEHPVLEQPELPLLAAERLEALSRRRGKKAGAEGEGQDVAGKKGGSHGGTAKARATATPEPATAPAPAGTTTAAAKPGSAARPGAAATARESRGRTRPGQAPLPAGPPPVGALPAEPLRERRQAGRLAAAAAAAAAAAREPLRPRHEPHHAMPIGRRLFEQAEYKAPPIDAFSAAEMAAAVEAVDALDNNGGARFDQVPAAAGTGDRQAGGQSDLMDAVDATGADDSIALRIALMTGAADFETAEQEARFVDEESADEESANEASAREASAREASEDSFEAAEAMAGAANFLPLETGSDRTAEPSAGAIVESPDTASIDLVDADAAEAAAVAEAISEVTSAAQEEEPEPGPTRKQFRPTVGEEPSEEEAEAQALREAMAFVLEADGRAAEADADSSPEDSGEPVESAQPVESAGHSEAASPQEPAESSEPPESEAGPEQSTRRHGLFHRIRGS